MNAQEIIALLETPTSNGWRLLKRIRDEAQVSDLIEALQISSDFKTRASICHLIELQARAEFFEGTRSHTKQAVPALLDALSDDYYDVHYAALNALTRIADPAAGPTLFTYYQQAQEDDMVGTSLIYALGACHCTAAFAGVIKELSSPSPQIRSAATYTLSVLDPHEAKELLRKSLASETDPLTKEGMEATLDELEHPTTREQKIDTLIAKLAHADAEQRVTAATALGDIVDVRVLPPLLAALRDEHHDVRRASALALAGLAENSDLDWFDAAHKEEVLPPLLQALHDEESSVREAVAQAVGDWRATTDTQAVEALLTLIHDQDKDVRKQVVKSLSYPKDERALDPLLHVFFTDEDEEIRKFAAQGLERFADARAVNSLIAGLQNKDAHQRQQAAEMLCSLRDERATDALLVALRDSEREVRE